MVAFRARDARIRSVAAQRAQVIDQLIARPLGVIRLDRGSHSLGWRSLPGNVQPPIDVADFQHLALQDHLGFGPKQ
jgi:hypothetical protein